MNLGVKADDVRGRLEAVVGQNRPPVAIRQITPTSRVRKVIEISFEESQRLGHRHVGTEHLLLGLLVEGEGIGARVLKEMDVTEEKVRAEVDRMLRAGEVPPRATGAQVDQPFVSLHVGTVLHRASQQALRKGSGVTRLDHLLEVLVGEDGLDELAALLDRRGVPWNPPEELKQLSSRLHEVEMQNAEAASRQQDDVAARLRDEHIRLREEYRRAEMVWLRPFWLDQPPP
jgi:ATP-dependent Clp protease ATP-binding subunit ClpC